LIRHKLVLGLVFAAFFLAPAWASTEVFPEGERVFKKLLADPEEINSGGLFSRQNGVNVIDFSIANHFAFQRWQFGMDRGWTAEWGLSFVVFGRLRALDEMTANDFIINFPLGMRRGPLSARVTLGHESAHLGDEFISRTGGMREKFSREFLQGVVSLQPFDRLRVYGGYTYPINTDSHRDPQEFQAGLESSSETFGILQYHRCWLYFAHDFQLKKELGWQGNNNTQAGLAVAFQQKGQRLRLFVNYFDGFSSFGQFFSQKEETLSFGIAFDH